MNLLPIIQNLHNTFCRAAGHDATDMRYYHQFERTWYEFHREQFTAEELELVVEYVKRRNKIASGPVYRRPLTPDNIVGDLKRFMGDLQEAKRIKAERDRQRDPRQNVLNAWRGKPPEQVVADNVVPLKDALRNAINQL